MEIKELEAAVEAILFTMGEAVEVSRIAAALMQDTDTVRRVVRSMMEPPANLPGMQCRNCAENPRLSQTKSVFRAHPCAPPHRQGYIRSAC